MGWENVQKTAKIIQSLILPDFQQFLDVFSAQGVRLEFCLHLKMSIKVILYFYGDRIKNSKYTSFTSNFFLLASFETPQNNSWSFKT